MARQEKIQWNYTDASGEKWTCQGSFDGSMYSERQVREMIALATWQLPEVYQPLCGRFNDEIASDRRNALRAKWSGEKETAIQEFDQHIERLRALKVGPRQVQIRDQKVAWVQILKEVSSLLYDFRIQGNAVHPLRVPIGGKPQDAKCLAIMDKVAKLDGDARCIKLSAEWTKCLLDSLGPGVDFGGQTLNEDTIKKTLGDASCKATSP